MDEVAKPLTTEPFRATGSRVDAVAVRLLERYLRVVARRGHARVVGAGGAVLGAAAITRGLASRAPDRPRLIAYWGADALAIASLPFLERAFLDAVREVTFLFDDTFGGRVCAGLIDQLGGRCVMLARPGRPERLEQLRDVVRRGGSYAFAVDGGGPYFEVGSGIATLARTLRAHVVPVAAAASTAVPWVHRSRISFPLPGCRITTAIGEPIDGVALDRARVAADLQASLVQLGARVRERSRARGWSMVAP